MNKHTQAHLNLLAKLRGKRTSLARSVVHRLARRLKRSLVESVSADVLVELKKIL